MKFRNPFKKLKSDLTIESMSKLGSTSSTHDDSSSSIDDTRSTTTASSSPSKKRGYVHKIISTLADRPELFESMLKLAQEGSGVTAVLRNLKGVRYELLALASSAAKHGGTGAMLPTLLRNGLLEELTSIEPEKTALLFDTIFSHKFVIEQLRGLGLESIPPQNITGNLNILLTLARSLNNNSEIIQNLSISLADYIELGQKIGKTKDPAQHDDLKTKQTIAVRKIRDSLLETLSIEESKAQTVALISGTLPMVAKALDEAGIATDKTEKLKLIALLDKQITESSGKDPKTKKNLVEQRNALINSEGITPIDQASFAIRTAMKLKPDGKLENIANVAVPVLDKVLGHYQDLSNIIKAFDQLGTTDIAKAEPEKLNSLVQAGMKLFQHEDILTAATDKSVQNAYSANFGSDLEGLSITIADRLGSAPIILDTALGKEGFQAILPKILDLPNVRAISKLTDAQVESLKRATPAIADYMNKVAKAIVIGNPKLFKAVGKAAKEFREADSESRPAKLISLANAGMSLISEAEVSSAILNKESLTAIVSDFIPSANKKLGLAGIEIACDHKDYFLNAIRTVLKQPEAVKVAEILPKYLAATSAEEKSALLGELAVASAELAGNTQVSEAILDSEKLDYIIAQASKIPAMQELFSSFKEDLTPLREALQSATPSILNAAKQGIHKKEVQDLLIKGSALANSPLDTKKVIGLAKDAIKLYNNSPELHVTINENIAQKQKEIASIIDKSLSVVKKSSLSLRLLKPLGINGEFIVSMMQKINNSKGIEALEKCIDSPSISNIIGVLSSTQTRNFVLGHVTGSATKYALSGAKSISTNIGSMIGDNKSWVHRVTTNPTPIRNR